jgi:DNA-binding transcriptional ArsR family regulator
MENFEAQAKLFKALRHPARLAILALLRGGEACVCHLEAGLGYRQAYISQQLMALKEAGLVQDRREGWNIFYRVTQPGVFEVIDAAQAIVSRQGTNMYLPQAGRLENCACPRCALAV